MLETKKEIVTFAIGMIAGWSIVILKPAAKSI
jgi:hypothetical protein